MDSTKICGLCKEEKNIFDFNKDSSRKDGLQNKCRECKKSIDKEYVKTHRERNIEKSKLWRINNKDKCREYIKEWISNNPERYKSIQKKHWDKSYQKNKLRKLVSNAIKKGLKNPANSKSIFSKLGYSPEDLKNHIEKLFKDDMSWENYGEWHIDHIEPQSWLHFESLEDENFLKCWNLNNLQPMWAKENISKQNRYSGSPDGVIEYKK